MGRLALSLASRRWPLRTPFVISRQTIHEVETLDVQLTSPNGIVGRGSAVGLDYAGETIATMTAAIEAVRASIAAGLTRDTLIELLPAGGARAALDAALWDVEAKLGGGDPFARAGLTPAPVWSSLTLSLCPPEAMERAALSAQNARWLKLKVGADLPIETVAAARRGAPAARFIVDPNQAWDAAMVERYAPALAELGVELLEQPIPVGAEATLDGVRCSIPLCADEAVDGIADLGRVAGRFEAVNIKLDKAGGLTAALRLADAAQAAGLKLMVGCMLAPSRAIAPAMVLAQRCCWVDLDGPPFLVGDDPAGFRFEDGCVERPYNPNLWG